MYPPAPVPWDHVTVSTKESSNLDNYYSNWDRGAEKKLEIH